jgi:hypothetical protein
MAVFIDDYTSSTWATDSITKYLFDKNMAGSFAISKLEELPRRCYRRALSCHATGLRNVGAQDT